MSITVEEYTRFVTSRVFIPQAHAAGLASVGLLGETGEITEHWKKHLFHGKPLDGGKLILEMGDGLWYYTLMVTLLEDDHLRGQAFDTSVTALPFRALQTCLNLGVATGKISTWWNVRLHELTDPPAEEVLAAYMKFWLQNLTLMALEVQVPLTEIMRRNVVKLEARETDRYKKGVRDA